MKKKASLNLYPISILLSAYTNVFRGWFFFSVLRSCFLAIWEKGWSLSTYTLFSERTSWINGYVYDFLIIKYWRDYRRKKINGIKYVNKFMELREIMTLHILCIFLFNFPFFRGVIWSLLDYFLEMFMLLFSIIDV